MKNRIVKALVSLCCVAVLFSMFGTMVSAKRVEVTRTDYTGYNADPANFEYYQPVLVNTQQQAKYFVINTTVAGREQPLYISLPAEGGFRIQTQKQGLPDDIHEPSSIATIEYKNDNGAVLMTGSDGTSLRFTQANGGFTLQVHNAKGKRLVNITNRQLSFGVNRHKGVVRTVVEMPLAEREAIYGGGERFDDTDHVGNLLRLENTDCWSWENLSYNNVPIWHSNRGYSLWFNMYYSGEARFIENEGETPKKYSIAFNGPRLDFYVWTGTPTENIKKYTKLTGTSGVYEEWTMGFWTGAMSRAFDNTKQKNAYANLVLLLQGYKDNYGFYPEAVYGEGQNSSTVLSNNFARQRNVRMLYWFYPSGTANNMATYLPGLSSVPTFDEEGKMISGGHLYPWNKSLLQNGLYARNDDNNNFIDFSNSNAPTYVTNYFSGLWNLGVSGAMLDYGEYLNYQGIFGNGMHGSEMHNFNSYYYAKVHNQAWTERFKNDYVLFERSGTAGSQYYTGNFLGDQKSDWDGFKKQLYALVSMGASGFNLYGGDLGGLGGKVETNDLWNRWVALSTFSPWMRQHGANIHMPFYKDPATGKYEYGELAAKTFGNYYYFRKNLVPTTMSAMIDANKTSNPMVKGMMIAYPYQLSLATNNNQYLFCDDFLVCAVHQPQVHCIDVSLPSGSTWYSLTTYEALKGGQKVKVDAPTAFMPVFVKGGAVKAINLPESMKLGDEMHDETDSIYSPIPSLLITPPDKNARTSVIHVKDGESTDFRTYKSHTETYTSIPTDSTVFTVANTAGSNRQIVLALGATAAAVTCDGKELSRLDHMPSYADKEYGYYVDVSGLTTIYAPSGWKNLAVTKGESPYKPLELEETMSGHARMLDDDPSTAYQLPRVKDNAMTELDFKADEPQTISRVVIKWTQGYLNDYDLEYRDDSGWHRIETDPDLEHTVANGTGSIDTVDFDPVTASAIRLVRLEKEDGTRDSALVPSIYDLKVYAESAFSQIPVVDPDDVAQDDGDSEDWGDEEEWDEWFEEVEYEDGDGDGDEGLWEEVEDPDDEKPSSGKHKKNKKKQIIVETNWLWLILLLVGIAVVIITGLILLFFLLAKKKKKKEAEQLAAAEDSPTDFPEPPPAG